MLQRTDIFLAGLKGMKNVTLLGTPSRKRRRGDTRVGIDQQHGTQKPDDLSADLPDRS